MANIEIISHPLCPYTHRLRMIAAAKGWKAGADFKLTVLPYSSLPASALAHSPRGELPVLKLDGVFQTSKTVPIAEYFDAMTGLGLLPSDPVMRLKVRERERRAGELLDTMRSMFAGQTAADVTHAVDSVFDQLEIIDADLRTDDTTEATMRMDMAALEPAFALLLFFPQLRDHARWSELERLKQIGERSLKNPVVRDTLAPNYGEELEAFFRLTRSAFPAAMLGRSC